MSGTVKRAESITIKQPSQNDTVNLALDTIGRGKQALVFVNTRASAEKVADDIAAKVKLDGDARRSELDALSLDLLHSLSRPTKQCERLARNAKKGIAFHHSGVTASQREKIEDEFKSGKVKVICCTPTLAIGVDLPAFRAIIRDVKRFSGNWGQNWIPVLEYLQMAGRAGRPKFDDYGEAIVVTSSEGEKQDVEDRYLLGVPEDIYSKLAVEPVLRTYLLSLIAADIVRNKEEIMDFFSHTFWAHQFEDMPKLEKIITNMLLLLESYEFIKGAGGTRKDVGFVSASELQEGRIRATALGKRVAELYLDPYTANHILTSIKRSESKPVTSFGLLQMVSHTIEMRPLLRVKVKEYEAIQQAWVKHETDLLMMEPSSFESEYDDFLNSIKTALFFEDWIDEKEENFLLETYSVRPGEIRYKLDKADWLLYATSEIARIAQIQPVLKEVLKVRFRVKYGVREELLPLLKLKGIGRVRARKLFAHKVRTIGDIKSADPATLGQIIGRKIAQDVKKEVGQEVVIIPEKRRKGQISLADYK